MARIRRAMTAAAAAWGADLDDALVFVGRMRAPLRIPSAGAGFWRPWPHLVLERRLHFPEEMVSGTEHAVIDERGSATVYRIGEQHFSRETLEALLVAAGFDVEELAADLTGAPWTPESETLAVIARST